MVYTDIHSIKEISNNVLIIILILYYISKIIYYIYRIVHDRNGRKRLVRERIERQELRSKRKIIRIKKEDWEKEKDRIVKENKKFEDRYGKTFLQRN